LVEQSTVEIDWRPAFLESQELDFKHTEVVELKAQGQGGLRHSRVVWQGLKTNTYTDRLRSLKNLPRASRQEKLAALVKEPGNRTYAFLVGAHKLLKDRQSGFRRFWIAGHQNVLSIYESLVLPSELGF
jgi:hypothetical protein